MIFIFFRLALAPLHNGDSVCRGIAETLRLGSYVRYVLPMWRVSARAGLSAGDLVRYIQGLGTLGLGNKIRILLENNWWINTNAFLYVVFRRELM